MAKTLEQLTVDVQQLNTLVEGLEQQIKDLNNSVAVRTKLSDMMRTEANLDAKIKQIAEVVVTLEGKLQKISLPEDSRFYLSESEITDFRANFNKLLAMLASFEQLYKNLVAYSVNNVVTQ